MPSLRGLECFVTVMRTGSVTRAAQELYMSQPALSHQLAVLETELGTRLFERLPRGVRPTAAAREIETDARLALAAAQRTLEVGRAVGAGMAGRLRIGVAESMTVPVLAPVLGEWLAARPGVGVSLTESSSADSLGRGLAAGELDLTIAPRAEAAVGAVTVLGSEEILLAMAEGHRLARRRAGPTLADLAGEPIVHYARENGLRDWLDARAAAAGVVLGAAVETRQAVAAARLAAAGLGLALVPATAVGEDFPGRLRPLRPRLLREVVMTRVDAQDPLVASFGDALVARGVPSPRR